jgi:hypothetical protein
MEEVKNSQTTDEIDPLENIEQHFASKLNLNT